jgi:hypothetical protein
MAMENNGVKEVICRETGQKLNGIGSIVRNWPWKPTALNRLFVEKLVKITSWVE